MEDPTLQQFIKSARQALDELEHHPQDFKSAIMAIHMSEPVEWNQDLTGGTVYTAAGDIQDAYELWRSLGERVFLQQQ